MKRINSAIDKYIEKIIVLFIISQPVIDVFTAIMLKVFSINITIGVIIRLLFLLFMCYYLFFINKKKNKKSIVYIFSIFVYMLLFLIGIYKNKGNSFIILEIKNLFKVFYFPILLVIFYELYKEKKLNISIKLFRNLFIIYSLLVLIPNLFNIGFSSYAVTKEGSIGLFYTANEISAIISILMPLFIFDVLKTKNKYIIIISTIVLLYLVSSIGTKSPLLSLGIIVILYLIKYFITLIKNHNYKNLTFLTSGVVLIFLLCILLLPKTTFYKNIETHLKFLKVDEVSDLAKPKIFDHFIFSSRLKFWNKTNLIYKNSNIYSKLFGIGYYKVSTKSDIKMIEMDYVDIFYHHGLIGFIIYISSLIYIIYLIIKRNRRKDYNDMFSAYQLSIFLALLLSLLTGHVITSPSVSIFVALIINLFYNEISKGDNYE